MIGITGGWDRGKRQVYLRQSYLRAVAAVGGLPVVLPVGIETAALPFYLDHLDGLVLSGGGDIDPAFFGEAPRPALGAVSAERDEFEMAIVDLALQRELPILGICRGMQVLNVAAGGDLYQDLPSESFRAALLQHQQEPGALTPNCHPVRVEAGSRLAKLLKLQLPKTAGPEAESELKAAERKAVVREVTAPEAADLESVDAPKYPLDFNSDIDLKAAASSGLTISVNSRHHQAVRKLAARFEVSACAPDGIVEAIETRRGSLVMGVQWHPEDIWEAYPRFLGLFQGLVEAAAPRRFMGSGRPFPRPV